MPPQKFTLSSANEYYGIFFDEQTGLQYVKPTPLGAQKIIENYNKKYDVRLRYLEIRASQSPEDIQKEIKQIADRLKDGEVVGVALSLMFKETPEIYHTSPLILAKRDGEIVMIRFKDSKMDGFLAGKEIEKTAQKVKKIEQ